MGKIRVFVASPGDVAQERKLVGDVARSLTTICAERGVHFDVQVWETDVRPRLHADGPQGPINQDLPVESFDIVVGIFWKRFGTPMPDQNNEIGTEYELRRAIKAGLATGKPEVVVFFNETPYKARSVDELDQEKRVLQFRAELKGLKPEYLGPEDFEKQIREYLIKYLVNKFPLVRGKDDPIAIANPEPYVRALEGETATIDVQGFKFGDKTAMQLPIDEFYIQLTTTSGNESVGGRGTVPLESALAKARLLVVGDPGAGKSTFLRRAVHDLCKAWTPDAQVPLLIGAAALSDYVTLWHRKSGPAEAWSPDWIPLFLGDQCREKNRSLTVDYFRAALGKGRCRVLIDGLDEAPDETARLALARLIREAALAYRNCNFVVTSRPEGKVAIAGFEEVRIGDLEPEAIQAYLARLSEKLYENDPNKREAFRAELQGAVDSRPEIRKMARNPVMLTALAVLQHNSVKLPEKRVDLYGSILDWLSKARKDRPGRLSPTDCLLRLRELAFEMQNHEDGRRKQVTIEWAGDKLSRKFGGREKAEKFLIAEQADSGIVVSRGRELAYWHLTFQEFLAAAEIWGWEDADQHKLLVDAGRLYEPEWRETALLYGGLLHNVGPKKVDALFRKLLDKMGPKPSLAHRAKCVGLIGAMVRDLVGYGVPDARFQESLRLVMDIFDAEKSKEVPFNHRLAAAEALGQAGDPRLDTFDWVTIPRSENYRFGATKQEDPDAQDNEKPRALTVEAFRIARYPVTVSQYMKFVENGGKEPYAWDKQQAHPTWPVTGVDWHQATEFAQSVGARLPTEWEWERAARGPKRTKYPWGQAGIDETRANYEKSGIGHATPVGLYPLGASAEGVRDLIGNVWEWTSSKYDERLYVLRGGSFGSGLDWARPSCRVVSHPENQYSPRGLRLAWGIP